MQRGASHYPLETSLLGHAEQRQAVFEGFGERDSRAAEVLHQGLQVTARSSISFAAC